MGCDSCHKTHTSDLTLDQAIKACSNCTYIVKKTILKDSVYICRKETKTIITLHANKGCPLDLWGVLLIPEKQ